MRKIVLLYMPYSECLHCVFEPPPPAQAVLILHVSKHTAFQVVPGLKICIFESWKNTAHPPIIGALGHSTDCIVKQPKTATIRIDLYSYSGCGGGAQH